MASTIVSNTGSDLILQAAETKTVKIITDTIGTVDVNDLATKIYVSTTVNSLIDNAPSALNTLNELSAALGDDENFASNVMTAISTKINSTDVYNISEIDSKVLTINNAIGLKANSSDVYTISEVNSLVTNLTSLINDKEDTFLVDPPVSSKGQLGDTGGMVSISQTHIYVCINDYTDGIDDIWARTPLIVETW